MSDENIADNKKQAVLPVALGFLTRQAQRPAVVVLAATAGKHIKKQTPEKPQLTRAIDLNNGSWWGNSTA